MGSDQSRPQRQPPAASPRPPHRRASPITVSSETIDGGYFTPPPGVYTSGKDWKSRIVRKLISERKLAPFYVPLNELDSLDELPPYVDKSIYKGAIECPICFLYFPRVNETQCCHQKICSECFLQIRRAEPHLPPAPNSPSTSQTSPSPTISQSSPGSTNEEVSEDGLVSEPSSCPFCVESGFGVSHNNGPTIHTDDVRPEWSSKLSQARSHAARRSAAATALHNAAFITQDRPPGFGAGMGIGSAMSNRGLRHRLVDLEEMMVMEAIRLSLVDAEIPRESTPTPALVTQTDNTETFQVGDSIISTAEASSSSANSSSSELNAATRNVNGGIRSLDERLLESELRDSPEESPRREQTSVCDKHSDVRVESGSAVTLN